LCVDELAPTDTLPTKLAIPWYESAIVCGREEDTRVRHAISHDHTLCVDDLEKFINERGGTLAVSEMASFYHLHPQHKTLIRKVKISGLCEDFPERIVLKPPIHNFQAHIQITTTEEKQMLFKLPRHHSNNAKSRETWYRYPFFSSPFGCDIVSKICAYDNRRSHDKTRSNQQDHDVRWPENWDCPSCNKVSSELMC
jgi:hypothetical protein